MTTDERQNDEFCVPLGGGSLELSRKEALELRNLIAQPGYAPLRKVMQAMNEADKSVLQMVSTGDRDIRIFQGKILAMAELTTILECDLKLWYDEGQSNKAQAEETA